MGGYRGLTNTQKDRMQPQGCRVVFAHFPSGVCVCVSVEKAD